MYFEKFPKIDAHFHATFRNDAYLAIAKRYNLRYININTDANVFPSVEEQEQIALEYQKEYPGYFRYICSFSMEGWQNEGWLENITNRIQCSIRQGAVGVKLWKNIGMEIRKDDGSFLMIDDDFFTPLFAFLTEQHIPVVAHLGEPLNCWLPLDEMTSDRNRRYFIQNPQYHAYLHPEIPSYQKQIDARDLILQRYPNLTFIGAHLGSLEWSYQELAKRLDTYPQFAVDVSSRLGHLQLQSIQDYEGVRDFFINYADRLLYGTDAYDNLTKLETSLVNDWNYLATDNICVSTEVSQSCKGLRLPEDVLYQIYYKNAESYYRL